LDSRAALAGRPTVRELPALALELPAPAERRACDLARALADFVSPERAVVLRVAVLLRFIVSSFQTFRSSSNETAPALCTKGRARRL
jgi:hypothetical protein